MRKTFPILLSWGEGERLNKIIPKRAKLAVNLHWCVDRDLDHHEGLEAWQYGDDFYLVFWRRHWASDSLYKIDKVNLDEVLELLVDVATRRRHVFPSSLVLVKKASQEILSLLPEEVAGVFDVLEEEE